MRKKIKKWEAIIDGYDPTTETKVSYCKRIGVSIRSFYYYRKKLGGLNSTQGSKNPSLVPLKVDQNFQIVEKPDRVIRITSSYGLILEVPL